MRLRWLGRWRGRRRFWGRWRGRRRGIFYNLKNIFYINETYFNVEYFNGSCSGHIAPSCLLQTCERDRPPVFGGGDVGGGGGKGGSSAP